MGFGAVLGTHSPSSGLPMSLGSALLGGSPLPPVCCGWVPPGWVTPGGGPSRVLTPSPLCHFQAHSPTPTAAVPGPGLSPPVGTHTHTHLCTLYELAGSLSSQHLLPILPIPPLYPVPVVPKGLRLGTSPPSPPPCSCMAPDTGQRVRLVVLLPQTIKPRWSVQGVLALLPGPAWGSQRSLGRGHCNLHCPHGAVQETRETSKTPLCPPWVHPARPPGPAQTPSGC